MSDRASWSPVEEYKGKYTKHIANTSPYQSYRVYTIYIANLSLLYMIHVDTVHLKKHDDLLNYIVQDLNQVVGYD